jgi:hypothetical protein
MLDIPTWWAETEKLLPMRRDLHRAMLMTGARRTSILTVRRADVDLDRKVFIFQHSWSSHDLSNGQPID